VEITHLDFNSWMHLGKRKKKENTEGPGSLGGIEKISIQAECGENSHLKIQP